MGSKDRNSTTAKKVFCPVVEGIVYSDRCLYKLRQMINGSKACQSCILRELEKLKAIGPKVPNDINDINDISDIKTSKKSKVRKRRAKKGSKPTGNEQTKEMYTTQELSEILGKAERTIQDYAKEGRIPGQKVGRSWHFLKEEIDRWLSASGAPKSEDKEEQPEFQKGDFIHVNQGEPEKEA